MEEQTKQRVDWLEVSEPEDGRVPFEDLLSELRY